MILRLKHYLHSPLVKSIIEMVYSILKIEYFKDRVESFDDYYPCIGKEEIVIMVMCITG